MVREYYDDEKHLLKTFLKGILFNRSNYAADLANLPDDKLEEMRQNMAELNGSKLRQSYKGIEFIVRPECNLKCEYCYIHQYGNELYPKEQRVDNTTLLQNLKIMLNYIYNKNQLYIHTYDLFSGDLFYDNFIFDILDVFYEYLSEEHKKYKTLYTQFTNNPMMIRIPTNPTFMTQDDKVQRYEKYYEKFWNIGVMIHMSISTDGYHATDSREHYQYSDEEWDKIFRFCQRHGYFFHPMVSAENIDTWIQNYEWWKSKIQEYDFEAKMGPGHYLPMMLEVRNNNWTPDKIRKYIQFLNYLVDDRFAMCGYDLDTFTKILFTNDETDTIAQLKGGYDPILLIQDEENENLLCDLQQLIHIRLNDLTIVPCHRTTYRQFEIGKFVIDPTINKIIDIEPYNVAFYIQIMCMRRSTMPRCARCDFQPFCIGGCLGSQYETNGEIFSPCSTVCDLLHHKYAFLVEKYTDLGVFEKAKELHYLPPKMEAVIETVRKTEVSQAFQKHGKCNE